MSGGLWKGLALLICLACPWLLYLGAGDHRAGSIGAILVAAYGVPHAIVYVFLLWLFGRTLRTGSEPLVTGVARRVHGSLAPDIESYTRQVTWAWCVFFAAQLVLSAGLLASGRLDAWTLFVGALNFPLLALMFTVEYLYRITRYPDHPRVSFARMLRAFVQDTSVSAGSRPR